MEGVLSPLDLRRGYATSCPPRQVNDSNKGSNGLAGSRSGKPRRNLVKDQLEGVQFKFKFKFPLEGDKGDTL